MGWITKSARRATAVLALATSVALTGGTLAHADNLGDTISDIGEGIVMEAGSPTWKAAGLRLVATTTYLDKDAGCNIDSGEAPLVLDIITPPGVTADQDPFIFTGCTPVITDAEGNTRYDNQQIKFQASSNAVSGNVRVEVISGPAGGGTYTNLVQIPITITQPANTKPSVAITGVSNGSSHVVGSVPKATCSVTDTQDGPSSFAATLSGALSAAGLGDQTATCNYTDKGGLKADTKSVTYSIVAPPNTKPTVAIGGVTDDATYEIGDVPAATCAVTDAEDGTSTKGAVLSGELSHGLGSQTASCDYTDKGGLSADTRTATYTVADRGNPTMSSALTPAAPDGTNGWYTRDVEVDFSCADEGGSGIDTCTDDTTLGEGTDRSVTGKATDWAGNTATETVTGINIDETAPTVAIKGGPAASSPFGTDPAAAPTCEATDSLSGLASCAITGGGTTVGPHTFTATAVDKAGNKSTATLNYTITPWTTKGYYSPVDGGGVWNTVKGGSSVPLKFEAFSGTTELTTTTSVKSFTQRTVTCPSASAAADEIEIVTTGGTSLRYDTTAGHFMQNWQTPKKPGTCIQATVTLQDGTTLGANFSLK
jgi:hypothetical protein